MKLPEAPVPWDAQMEALFEEDGPVDLIVSYRLPVDDKGRYLHWDEVRSRTPPSGLDVQSWWLAMRPARDVFARDLPLRTKDGEALTFSNVDEVQRLVHHIDQEIGGRVGTPGDVSAQRTRRFVR